MRMIKRLGVVGALVLATVLGVGAQAANAAGAAPSNVHVSLYNKSETVGWSAVPGATSYTVIVSRDGYAGPYAGFTTTSTSINISYANFPYRSATGGKAYRFSVGAKGAGWSSTTKSVKVMANGTLVSTSNTNVALKKIADCNHQGSAAALVVGGAGGVAALVTIWIPGVDVVTAGGLATAMAATYVATSVVCVLS
ncbi:hypothetical protein P5G50_15875 [Leifsonia sp. F6_8S_P_1B]|uniref:Fibronectin type-III domain-containing protein n=1 Tax=Leifsonia williamsii TaxID=3035919 RepID=A0ABT8KEQ0_9MICO|nr:hypothetical protein [Leifsonia williamsii]MDN4615930.1 hypothetical protein [Leifsonia williamsii]